MYDMYLLLCIVIIGNNVHNMYSSSVKKRFFKYVLNYSLNETCLNAWKQSSFRKSNGKTPDFFLVWTSDLKYLSLYDVTKNRFFSMILNSN